MLKELIGRHVGSASDRCGQDVAIPFIVRHYADQALISIDHSSGNVVIIVEILRSIWSGVRPNFVSVRRNSSSIPLDHFGV